MWQTFPSSQMQSMVIDLRDGLSKQYDREMDGAAVNPSFDMKVSGANAAIYFDKKMRKNKSASCKMGLPQNWMKLSLYISIRKAVEFPQGEEIGKYFQYKAALHLNRNTPSEPVGNMMRRSCLYRNLLPALDF